MVGETLAGRYLIERLLGEGAMGSVYLAQHTGTGRKVAVKVIAGELAKHPNILARFQVEARAAGVVDSQHIAQVLDVGRDEQRDLPFLVMELLNGEDLQQLQQRLGFVPPDLVARICAQACMGLSRAHAAKIVHRDIKPGNMFLTIGDDDTRIVKLLDFGIAKMKMDEVQAEALTRTGSLIGTPLYMSPEQARGEKIIDARADIWSLGVVMYQLLCGRTPNHHIEALGKLIIEICSVPAPWILDFAPWVPNELAVIVHKCLEIEQSARFQSADELLGQLRKLLPNGTTIEAASIVPLTAEQRMPRGPTMPRPASVAPPGNPAPLARPASVGPPTARSTDPGRAPTRGRAAALLAVLIALLILGGVGVFVVVGRASSTPGARPEASLRASAGPTPSAPASTKPAAAPTAP